MGLGLGLEMWVRVGARLGSACLLPLSAGLPIGGCR